MSPFKTVAVFSLSKYTKDVFKRESLWCHLSLRGLDLTSSIFEMTFCIHL
jgi:hypothetical protein